MSSIIRKRLKQPNGFSLVETIFYLSILALVLFLSVGAIYSFIRSYQRLQSSWIIESAATTALERMTREIRDASSVDLSGSVLDVSPGRLVLNTASDDGAATTVQFLLENQIVRVVEADADGVPLTPAGARVTSLIFRRIVGANSQAIKIEMTAESGAGSSYQSGNFYSTVVLRGSYSLQ